MASNHTMEGIDLRTKGPLVANNTNLYFAETLEQYTPITANASVAHILNSSDFDGYDDCKRSVCDTDVVSPSTTEVFDLDSTVDALADVVIPRTYWGENKVTGRPKGQDSMRMITEWMMEGINTITIPVLAQYPDTIVSPYICRTTTRSDKNCSTAVVAADTAADATRIDVSKMDQWNIILDWAEINGMVVEFQLEDSSKQFFLDGGNTTLGLVS
jgi:hypothetical protein